MRIIRIILKSPLIIIVFICLFILFCICLLKEIGFSGISKIFKKAVIKTDSADIISDMTKANKIDNSINKMSDLLKRLTK